MRDMNRIYNCVGKLLQIYQKIEQKCELLIYCDTVQTEKDEQKRALKFFDLIDKKTFGLKLKSLKNNDVIDTESFDILDYLRGRRNYLVHEFFIEEKLENIKQIKFAENKLNEMYYDAKMIDSALFGVIQDLNSNAI